MIAGMKHFVPTVIAATLIAVPCIAWADQNDAPPAPPPAGFQIMEQTRAKVDQLNAQARESMLATLSPAQRTQLAQVVGQLAIAQTPDTAAAAKTLDASLTQAQAKNILSISSSLDDQVRQVMDASRKQMEAAMPDGAAPHSQWGMHAMRAGGPQDTDPGMILLSMSARALGAGEVRVMGGPPLAGPSPLQR
jgi:hypothetical protein